MKNSPAGSNSHTKPQNTPHEVAFLQKIDDRRFGQQIHDSHRVLELPRLTARLFLPLSRPTGASQIKQVRGKSSELRSTKPGGTRRRGVLLRHKNLWVRLRWHNSRTYHNIKDKLKSYIDFPSLFVNIHVVSINRK